MMAFLKILKVNIKEVVFENSQIKIKDKKIFH